MLKALDHFDHRLFLHIHHWRNAFLDEAMPLITGKWLWIPLYAVLCFFLWKRFGKKLLLLAGVIALLVLLSDQSANLVKNSVCRPRPCHDTSITETVYTPLGCGGAFGFVSSHAANTFALATFLWLLSGYSEGVRPVKKRWPWLLLFPWSLLVCWSRIYVGVHFPFDLLGGCVIGAFWAVVLFLLYKKVIQ